MIPAVRRGERIMGEAPAGVQAIPPSCPNDKKKSANAKVRDPVGCYDRYFP